MSKLQGLEQLSTVLVRLQARLAADLRPLQGVQGEDGEGTVRCQVVRSRESRVLGPTTRRCFRSWRPWGRSIAQTPRP